MSHTYYYVEWYIDVSYIDSSISDLYERDTAAVSAVDARKAGPPSSPERRGHASLGRATAAPPVSVSPA